MKQYLLYTALKVFHFMDKVDSLPQEVTGILAPIHIRIKPTNVCGHNCWYCAYRATNLQLGRDMQSRDFIPKTKMLEIIDDISEMGVKAVTFSGGGDPFFYPYLLDAVKALSKTPIKFAALTNGSRLFGEVAEIFADRATWLRVSIDGWDDESYSKYREVRVGEWSKVMSNLKEFKKFGGKCFLGVSFIIDQKNADHIFETIKRLKDIGVDSVKVSACITSDDTIETNKYHEPIFDKVRQQIQRSIMDLSDGKFEIFDAYHRMQEEFKKDYVWCPYAQILPVIGADLNIYPCQDKAYNLENGLIGSIKNIRFKDFWFAKKETFFNINPSIHCNNHCVANAKNKMILDYLGACSQHMDFV